MGGHARPHSESGVRKVKEYLGPIGNFE